MIDLRKSGLRPRQRLHDDFNPGEGALNLADVMLVFACGLLAAIITFWDVSLPSMTEVHPEADMAELVDAPTQAEAVTEGAGYTEFGVVYEDPKTGKLYMVVGEPSDGNR